MISSLFSQREIADGPTFRPDKSYENETNWWIQHRDLIFYRAYSNRIDELTHPNKDLPLPPPDPPVQRIKLTQLPLPIIASSPLPSTSSPVPATNMTDAVVIDVPEEKFIQCYKDKMNQVNQTYVGEKTATLAAQMLRQKSMTKEELKTNAIAIVKYYIDSRCVTQLTATPIGRIQCTQLRISKTTIEEAVHKTLQHIAKLD